MSGEQACLVEETHSGGGLDTADDPPDDRTSNRTLAAAQPFVLWGCALAITIGVASRRSDVERVSVSLPCAWVGDSMLRFRLRSIPKQSIVILQLEPGLMVRGLWDSRVGSTRGLRLVQPGRAYPYFDGDIFLGHSDRSGSCATWI